MALVGAGKAEALAISEAVATLGVQNLRTATTQGIKPSKIECDREVTLFITLVPWAIYPFRSVKLLPKIVKLGHK
jgi:hypothetical protein